MIVCHFDSSDEVTAPSFYGILAGLVEKEFVGSISVDKLKKVLKNMGFYPFNISIARSRSGFSREELWRKD